jgi:NADH-quinone oxidoreductase E subunit
MEIKFSDENLRKLEEIRMHYPQSAAALMPALWLAQEQFGWISVDVMKYIGNLLRVPYEQVYGVVNFYTMYNKKPVGKHHLQVCTNVSCMLRGAYDVLDYVSNKLMIKPGETSKDELFTLSEAECLGSCGTAPMMQINDYYEENLNEERLDEIISKLSSAK